MTHHCTPNSMGKIKNADNINVVEDVEQQERSFIAGGSAKWYSCLERQFASFLQN